jgi:hypothetical protein
MNQILIALSVLSAALALLGVGIYFIRKSQIDSTAVLIKETGQDERIQFSVNFRKGESKADMQEKVGLFASISDERKAYVFRKYEEAVIEAQKKQAEENLAQLKSAKK